MAAPVPQPATAPMAAPKAVVWDEPAISIGLPSTSA
jgi:hypothetical protein